MERLNRLNFGVIFIKKIPQFVLLLQKKKRGGYFLLLNTKYATASSPAIANPTSNTNGYGVGVGLPNGAIWPKLVTFA